MKYLVIFLVMLFWRIEARAQYNDTTHFHLNLLANGSINQADGQNTYLLNNALNFGVKEKTYLLTLSNTWVYGKADNALTNNDYSSVLYFDLNTKSKHFYYWGLANYNTSFSLKINEQLLTGAGIAYQVLDYKNLKLSLSDGALFDRSDLVDGPNYHTYRNSFRLQFHVNISPLFTLDGSEFLQNSVEDIHDYIIRTNTTFGLKLMKWLALTSALSYNKETNTNSDNLTFTYGVTLDKFF